MTDHLLKWRLLVLSEGNQNLVEFGETPDKSNLIWFKIHYNVLCRSFNSIAVSSLKQPWNKRRRELAEKKAAKELERELKETARQEKEVRNFITLLTSLYCLLIIALALP